MHNRIFGEMLNKQQKMFEAYTTTTTPSRPFGKLAICQWLVLAAAGVLPYKEIGTVDGCDRPNVE